MQNIMKHELKIYFAQCACHGNMACLAGNNIAICQNSTELAKELSRGSPSLIKKAIKEKQMRKSALFEIRIGQKKEFLFGGSGSS